MAGGGVHGKPYRAARAIGEYLRDRWVWIYGECIIAGCDLRDLDGYQLFTVGAAFAARAVTETKEEREAKTTFINKMNELCQEDEDYPPVEGETYPEPGARIVSNTPGPGEPGFTGSPGGLSKGVPSGVRELPMG